MMIKFDEIQEMELKSFQGGEGALYARSFMDERNRILRGRLVPGATIGYHCHATSSEVIFILSGEGKALIDGREERLKAGDCHYCPKGSSHALVNDSDGELRFYAVVPQQ